jgi:hypothetical protein
MRRRNRFPFAHIKKLDDVCRRELTGMSRVAVLNLERGMAYAETLPQRVAGAVRKDIICASHRADKMHR